MNKHKLTECEAQVLMTVYEADEPPSLPEIHENVNKQYNKVWKPQTVSTFLARLVKNGYLEMKRESRTFLYYTVYPVEEIQMAAVLQLTEIYFAGKAAVLKEFMAGRSM